MSPGRKRQIEPDKVRELLLQGLNSSEIARELKVDRSGVSRVIKNEKLKVAEAPPPSLDQPDTDLTTDSTPISISDSALPMLRDTLIEVREKLLKQISKTPERAERSIETLVKLSAEIRQVETAKASVREKLDDRKVVSDLFKKTITIIRQNVQNPLRDTLLEKFSEMKNEYMNEKPIREALKQDE